MIGLTKENPAILQLNLSEKLLATLHPANKILSRLLFKWLFTKSITKGELCMAQLIDLKINFTCNNHCIHCVISDKISERDLTLDEIKAMIDKYIERYGKIQLTLTGGEVTIRKDFFELMNFIKSRKEIGKITFVDLQTNGRMLSYDDRQKAAENVIDFYLSALHCDLPKVHDSITMVKGSFE